LTQTGQVLERLRELSREHQIECEFEIVKIVTKGDRILDTMLSKVGGKGLFVKEIEQALINKEIDIAIHSMKDMPFELPEGLMIGAIPEREDARDVIVSKDNLSLDHLPIGALVGTSSLRRACQVMHLRPDLRIESIRGNIDSRLNKLKSCSFDAILLAAAGLKRMGWEDRISAPVSLEQFVPAVGQGALGIECRSDDASMLELLALIQHEPTALAVRAERAFLGSLNGGCEVPIGAHATIDADASTLTITAIVGTPDGRTLLRETISGPSASPETLGVSVAAKLKEQGADQILAAVRERG
jgi:hydroxymethylbilane synthase